MNEPLSPDEIINLAMSVIELPERRLHPTWAYIQSVKYNGMRNGASMHQFIFEQIELSLIKRIYPPELVNKKIQVLIRHMMKETKEYSRKKTHQYMGYRNAGLSIEKAREKIRPIHKDWFLDNRIIYYSKPYKYKYDIDCRDADLLFDLGIDSFVKLFYDRFYEQVNTK